MIDPLDAEDDDIDIITLTEFFNKFEIECHSWAKGHYIEKDWLYWEYKFKEGVYYWFIPGSPGYEVEGSRLIFNGEELRYEICCFSIDSEGVFVCLLPNDDGIIFT